MPLPHGVALELLPGWADDWLIEAREELRLLQLYAFETCAQRLLQGGRCGEAAGLALNALNLDPLRESANRILIEIHLRDGNRLDALRQFRKYEQLLRRELDIEPGPTLTALVGSVFPSRATSIHLANT
jgi:DNA-binding SARP family transcriptional activator